MATDTDLDPIYEATQADHARSIAEQRRVHHRHTRGPPPRVWADIYDLMYRYRKTRSTIARWLRDPELDFPQPRFVRGKRIWSTAELDAFDERLLRQGE
jgi:hypothetical protein